MEAVRESPALQETIAFWFKDQDHLRSPFPPAIKEALTEQAALRFQKWVNLLDPKAQGEVDNEVVGEKIEVIIFTCAMELASDPEQRITIGYPFMPRPGIPSGQRTARRPRRSRGRSRRRARMPFLMVLARETVSGKEWSTRFELP